MKLILIYRELQENNAPREKMLAQRIVPSARGFVCMTAAASSDHVEAEDEDEKLRWRWDSVKVFF